MFNKCCTIILQGSGKHLEKGRAKEMESMTSTELTRLCDYLKAQGWNAKQVLDIIEYIMR